MANPTPTQHRRATQITNEIATLGFALPGSVALRYTTCGTSGCRCHADPPQPHGPYPSWTRKVAGKTITRRLSSAVDNWHPKPLPVVETNYRQGNAS